MRIDVVNFEKKYRGNGGGFELITHDLIRAIGRTVGIASHQIHWDCRTNMRDQGRDIVIDVGHTSPLDNFIPSEASIWSLKSGDDGVSPSSLYNEILSKNHTKIREWLKEGKYYVWCVARPASREDTDKMVAEAVTIAAKLGIDKDLISFRWQECITSELNRFPNIIVYHIPETARQFQGLQTLNEWKREEGMKNIWCDFGCRADMLDRISEHLLAQDGQNILHIAGLSGIGKTRTVLEACQTTEELKDVFYLGRYSSITAELYRYLAYEGQHVKIIVDETALNEVSKITAQLSDYSHRIRIITIGPATKQRQSGNENFLILPEPSNTNEVLQVISNTGSGLPEAVLFSIAMQSRHDLRLALKLTEASQRSPQYMDKPIISIDDILERLMTLFIHTIRDSATFLKHYEVLTISIDIGFRDEVRDELITIAKYFGLSINDLESAADTAASCGLGIHAARFFETTPCALAVRLFEDRVWPRVERRLEEFMGSLPPRLLRKFLERCQGCTDTVAEEVRNRIGNTFLGELNQAGVIALFGRESSRIFQAWVEFDPHRGLSWLRNAVEVATTEQLMSIDGRADGSGGWRGRRQLVWMCQSLASFAEHFESCEAILFRLALHETELSIGNNSIAIWKHLFWPALSGTELPFLDRLPILVRRLNKVQYDQLPLILAAIYDAMEPRSVGMGITSNVVGGRIVPKAWNPATHNEWHQLRQFVADRLLASIPILQLAFQNHVLNSIIGQLRLFRLVQRIDQLLLHYNIEVLSDELRRKIVIQLEIEISLLKSLSRDNRKPVDPGLPILLKWRELLRRDDLPTRIRDLTARNKYDTLNDNDVDPHADLARELIDNPDVLIDLSDWIESSNAKSVGKFAYQVGKLDIENKLSKTIKTWLTTDRCRAVTVTYLNGVGNRESKLPNDWALTLDVLETPYPELVAIASGTADVCTCGLERLLRVVSRLSASSARFLRPLAYGFWHPILTVQLQLRVLTILKSLAGLGDEHASIVALDLLDTWWHRKEEAFDPLLVEVAIEFAILPSPMNSDMYDFRWLEVLKLVLTHKPEVVAQLIVDRITDHNGMHWTSNHPVVDVWSKASAANPSLAMQAIGNSILDSNRLPMFGVCIYRGLFEPIGLDAVRNWIELNGTEHLEYIARHLQSPYIRQDGEVAMQDITRWLLDDQENNQEAFDCFLMGRSDGAFHWQGDQTVNKREEMEPFLDHPLRRVRQWATYEIERVSGDAKFFQKMDDERGRL